MALTNSEHALELDPNDPEAHRVYALALIWVAPGIDEHFDEPAGPGTAGSPGGPTRSGSTSRSPGWSSTSSCTIFTPRRNFFPRPLDIEPPVLHTSGMTVGHSTIKTPSAASFGMWWYAELYSGPGRTNLIG